MIIAVAVLYYVVGMMALLGFQLHRRITRVLKQAEKVLKYTEEHGKVSDSRADRVVAEVREAADTSARAATKAAHVVQEQITAVPDKIVERLRSNDNESSAADASMYRPATGQ